MKILLDSDGLFGLYVPSDPHHEKAKHLALFLRAQMVELYVTNVVIWETATVLSYKIGQELAIQFVRSFPSLGAHMVVLDESLESRGWEVFLRQTKKGTSFVDCANVAVIEELKLDGILSFDEFYPKELTEWMRR